MDTDHNENIAQKKIDDVKKNEIVQPVQKQIDEFKSHYLQHFDPICCLGKGGFGIVFAAQDKLTGTNYAIKRIPFPSCQGSKDQNSQGSKDQNIQESKDKDLILQKLVLCEVKALEELINEYIVRYFDAWIEEPPGSCYTSSITPSQVSEYDTTSDSHSEIKETIKYLYIKMELCKENSLRKWLLQTKNRDKKHILRIFAEITLGVEYIHSKGFIHRDLKPSNIFFSLDDKIKIGDFGLVTKMISSNPKDEQDDEQDDKQQTKQVGTHLYMSPEQKQGVPYDFKVDIYSLGIIFFELLNSFTTEMERCKTLEILREGTMPSQFLEMYKGTAEEKLLGYMLSDDPKIRFPATNIFGFLINNFSFNLNNRRIRYLDYVYKNSDDYPIEHMFHRKN